MNSLINAVVLGTEPVSGFSSCAECDQVAFIVVLATVDSQSVRIPLCGRHYLDAGIDGKLSLASSNGSATK